MLKVLCLILVAASAFAQSRIAVSFPKDQSEAALDGRVLVILSARFDRQPCFDVGSGKDTAQVFGIDVEGLRPGEPTTLDASVFGYPIRTLAEVPAGEYFVQALLHRYETFHRADGHVVKLPMDRGEGQHWNRAPGNPYSLPRRIRVDPAEDRVIEIVLDQQDTQAFALG